MGPQLTQLRHLWGMQGLMFVFSHWVRNIVEILHVFNGMYLWYKHHNADSSGNIAFYGYVDNEIEMKKIAEKNPVSCDEKCFKHCRNHLHLGQNCI